MSKNKYDCATNGGLGHVIIDGKRIGAVCNKSMVNGGCGAHGNKKCKHKSKVDKIKVKPS